MLIKFLYKNKLLNWGMTQVMERLPSTLEALSSIPSTDKKVNK
jgi:hypothetical protein